MRARPDETNYDHIPQRGRWIDADPALTVGAVGFLVGAIDLANPLAETTYRFSVHPALDIETRRPTLKGSAGIADDVSTVALGVWRVKRLAGERAYIRHLVGADEAEALGGLGYPELGGK